MSRKPDSNRDPEKAVQKVLQSTKKYPKLSKMGFRKEVQAAPFFVLVDHWDPPGHPHGPQSLQKRSHEAPKPQFCFFLASDFSHFWYNLDIFFTHSCSRFSIFFQTIFYISSNEFLSSGSQDENLDSPSA